MVSKGQLSSPLSEQILSSTVTVNFAPDGRLWRLTPTAQAVYLDYSTDNGKTYQQPIKINRTEQKIAPGLKTHRHWKSVALAVSMCFIMPMKNKIQPVSLVIPTIMDKHLVHLF
jgi:hypothetical protein